jgi:uroporphyrinogen-III synthase
MSKHILYLGLDPTHYQTDGEIFHWPIIQIVPRPLQDSALQQSLSHFNTYSHILITSKSTVRILKDYLPRLNIPLSVWANKMTLAVGQVTAQHLYESGISPTLIAQEETAEGLIEELKHLNLKQAHVFWPHSARARSVIPDFLRIHHIRHTTCVLYEPHSCAPDQLPVLEDFDEIVFTSPSTVEAFLNIFSKFPSHARLKTIGPVTARFLEEQIKKLRNS